MRLYDACVSFASYLGLSVRVCSGCHVRVMQHIHQRQASRVPLSDLRRNLGVLSIARFWFEMPPSCYWDRYCVQVQPQSFARCYLACVWIEKDRLHELPSDITSLPIEWNSGNSWKPLGL